MTKVARIDKKLNLIVPVYGEPEPRIENGKPAFDPETKKPIIDEPVIAWVHSTPIARDLFERYFRVIAGAWTMMMGGGMGITAGPACAALCLKDVAERQRAWEDDPATGTAGVRTGLLEEIRRLTNVIALTDSGWQPIPLAIAVDQGRINEEDAREVENAIVFFIVASAMLNRAQRAPMVTVAADLWGAQVSSLTSTEWLASLRTSTGTASSGEKSPAPASDEKLAATAPAAEIRLSQPL